MGLLRKLSAPHLKTGHTLSVARLAQIDVKAWCSQLGFFHLLAQLIDDQFNHICDDIGGPLEGEAMVMQRP